MTEPSDWLINTTDRSFEADVVERSEGGLGAGRRRHLGRLVRSLPGTWTCLGTPGPGGRGAFYSMVEVFRALPDDSELTSEYRRKLSMLLF